MRTAQAVSALRTNQVALIIVAAALTHLAEDIHAWTGVDLTPAQVRALMDRHAALKAEFMVSPTADTPLREATLEALCRELLGEPWPSGASDAGRHALSARLRTAAAGAGYAVRPVPHSPLGRIDAALDLLHRHGQKDGETHHQTWLLDQVVRALTGEGYRAWVGQYRQDEDGNEDAYHWDAGIAP